MKNIPKSEAQAVRKANINKSKVTKNYSTLKVDLLVKIYR